MLGITIRLGASKDQIVSTVTGHVFADRYEARNRVKRVQKYKSQPNLTDPKGVVHIMKPLLHLPVGMEYVAVPDNSYLKACHAVVMDAAKRGYGKRAA